MNRKLTKALKYGGYSVFAIVVLFVSAYMAFPFERLKDLITKKLSQGGRYDVTIGSVSAAFPIGVSLEDLVMVSRPERPKEKPSKMVIDQATVSFGFFSLLSGRPEIHFSVETLGGHIDGKTREDADGGRFIQFAFSSIEFEHLPGLDNAVDLPMDGTVSGSAKLTIPKAGMRKSKGKMTLACHGCSVGDGKHKVKFKFAKRPGHYDPLAEQGVTLPRLRLGKFGGDIVIKRGKATFDQFEAFSPDGEAQVLGSIMLRDPVAFSSVLALFKFKFSDDLKKRKPKTIGIESSMGRGRRADGMLGLCVTGRLKKPRFKPCKTSPVERGGGRFGGRKRRGGGRYLHRLPVPPRRH
ncbi:MAG: type II secretion system protein GspN [Deltaproteobacteria bacterium]|nr:type II secretion system protein GspN [Deltaproteobacteria bacterium]